MAKKPSGLGRGLSELLEDNTPSRRPSRNGPAPLVEAKDEFVRGGRDSAPSAQADRQASPTSSLYQTKAKPLYQTQRPTLKSNFKNNLKNK